VSIVGCHLLVIKAVNIKTNSNWYLDVWRKLGKLNRQMTCCKYTAFS